MSGIALRRKFKILSIWYAPSPRIVTSESFCNPEGWPLYPSQSQGCLVFCQCPKLFSDQLSFQIVPIIKRKHFSLEPYKKIVLYIYCIYKLFMLYVIVFTEKISPRHAHQVLIDQDNLRSHIFHVGATYIFSRNSNNLEHF